MGHIHSGCGWEPAKPFSKQAAAIEATHDPSHWVETPLPPVYSGAMYCLTKGSGGLSVGNLVVQSRLYWEANSFKFFPLWKPLRNI